MGKSVYKRDDKKQFTATHTPQLEEA